MKKLDKRIVFRRETLTERSCCSHVSTNRSYAKYNRSRRAKKKGAYELAGLRE